ncbi:hypothetical protein SBRY_80134 [Actinacidiphila bryophytorum]|uniref:Uncharacterized protein n=1 Tax=Actinacidiphila bryophytorum TaxID=1436133 RepID=A0A9W4H755_9ACTN|nr:hypothetical protein SBRY_80134 [Actinacidiphila bryophytorum]
MGQPARKELSAHEQRSGLNPASRGARRGRRQALRTHRRAGPGGHHRGGRRLARAGRPQRCGQVHPGVGADRAARTRRGPGRLQRRTRARPG